MNILLIEDEPGVAHFLKKGLEEQQFHVTLAHDGYSGMDKAVEESFDFIILDILLPKMNGWDVCHKLRKEFSLSTPILILSALDSTNHVIKGLNGGADDYLVKPFKLDELIARVYAIHRRHRGILSERNTLLYEGLEIDLETMEVFRGGEKIRLTAREFKLLEYFMKNPGRVLSRMKIMQNVWGVDFDLGTNVVDVYVNYLRKKIDKNFETKLLHTVIGMGYVLKKDEN